MLFFVVVVAITIVVTTTVAIATVVVFTVITIAVVTIVVILYNSLVLYLDMTQADAEKKLKVLNAIMHSIPGN